MLFAIDWIRVQLTTAYNFLYSFFSSLTVEGIGSFLTGNPAIMVIYILTSIILIFCGFLFYKLIISLLGASVMGYLGFLLGVAINPNYLSTPILWALIFVIIGLFVFYILHSFVVAAGIFIVSVALFKHLSSTLIGSMIAGAILTAILLILLSSNEILRTSIVGSTVIALIVFTKLTAAASFMVFLLIVPDGLILQSIINKRHKSSKEKAANFRPNAPRPPSAAEIAAEIEQEKREKEEMQSMRA